MARLWMCGFEQGSTGVLSSISGATISTVQKQTGARSLYTAAGQWGKKIFLPAGVAEIYLRVAMYFNEDSAQGGSLALFDSAGAYQLIFQRPSAVKQLEVWRGASVSKLATGSAVLLNYVWYVLFIHILVADALGRVEVKIDSIAAADDIDYTGDTKETANANVAQIQFGWASGAPYGQAAYFDDVAINDIAGAINNSYPPNAGIYGLLPTGAGTHAQWTPSAGANWDCVDEVPPSDVDYVRDATSGHQDSYAMANTPAAGVVGPVCWWARAKKENAGDKDVKRFLVVGGNDYASAAKVLTTSIAYYNEILELSPDTGIAWTTAEIDAMEAGAEVA